MHLGNFWYGDGVGPFLGEGREISGHLKPDMGTDASPGDCVEEPGEEKEANTGRVSPHSRLWTEGGPDSQITSWRFLL